MIDYDKLKLAYELAEKLDKIEIKLCYYKDEFLQTVFNDVDDLI